MSSRNRGAPPDSKENYPTPRHVADTLVAMAPSLGRQHAVLEPSAGAGLVAQALLDAGLEPALLDVCDPYHWPALEDLSSRGAARWLRRDFVEVARPRNGYSLIIGNPPFSKSADHVQHALHLLADDGILVFLLSAAWTHPKVRADLRSLHPPVIEVGLQERPSFSRAAGRKAGSDSVDYSIFAWRRQPDPQRIWWPKIVISTGTATAPSLDPALPQIRKYLEDLVRGSRGLTRELPGRTRG